MESAVSMMRSNTPACLLCTGSCYCRGALCKSGRVAKSHFACAERDSKIRQLIQAAETETRWVHSVTASTTLIKKDHRKCHYRVDLVTLFIRMRLQLHPPLLTEFLLGTGGPQFGHHHRKIIQGSSQRNQCRQCNNLPPCERVDLIKGTGES